MNKVFTYMNFLKIHYLLLLLIFCWIPGVKANSDGSGLLKTINHHSSPRSLKPVSKSFYRAANFDAASPNPTISNVTASSFVVSWTNNNANADNNQYQMVFVTPEPSGPIVLDPNHIYYNYIANDEVTDDNGYRYTLRGHYQYRNQNSLTNEAYSQFYQPFMYVKFTFDSTKVLDYPRFIHNNTHYSGGIPSSENYGGPVDESLKWVCVHNSTLNDISSVTVSNLPIDTKYKVLVVNWSYDKANNKFIYNTTIDATTSVQASTTHPVISLNNLSSSTASVDLAAHTYGDSSYVGIPITGTNLKSGITVTAPSGFLVKYKLATGGYSAYVQSYTIPATNNTNSNSNSVSSVVYIRSPSTLPAGSNQGQVKIHTQDADATIVINSATVNPARLSAVLNKMEKVYMHPNPVPTLTVTGFVNGDSEKNTAYSFTTDIKADYSSPVGSYPVTITSTTIQNFNYYIPSGGTGLLTITPATVVITPSIVYKPYGQAIVHESQNFTSFTSDGLQSNETIGSVSLAYGDGARAIDPVGSYDNSVSPFSALGGTFTATNYSIIYLKTALVVTAAPLSIAVSPLSKVYGQTLTAGAGSTAFTTTGLTNGETIGSISLAYGAGALATDAVNTYSGSVTPSAAAGGSFSARNYTITYPKAQLTVSPAPLAIATSYVSKVYGQVLTTVSGSGAFTSTGLQNGETIGSISLAFGTGALGTDAVNLYAGSVTPSAAAGGSFSTTNYTITYPLSDLTVTAAPLAITATSVSKVYGRILTAGPNSSLFTSTGLQNNETIGSVTLAYGTGALATDGVNTYTGAIIPSLAVNGSFIPANYLITYPQGTLTVIPALLQMNMGIVSKTYGKTLSSGKTAIFNVTGLQNKDKVDSLSLTYGDGSKATSPVNTYYNSVQYSDAQGVNFDAGNYNILYGNPSIYDGGTNKKGFTNLKVIPAPLSIEADDHYKTYGQPNPVLTITYTGFVNGEDSTVLSNRSVASTKATAHSAASTYAITLPVGAFNSNYTISTFDGNLTIGQAPLLVTADDSKKSYGQPNPALTITYTGFVNGDNASTLNIQPAISVYAGLGVNLEAGAYQVNVTDAVSPNYVISYAPGIFTVLPAPLTLTAMDTTKNYGLRLEDMPVSKSFTATGLQYKETISSVSIIYAQGRAAADAVGSYSGSGQISAATGGSAKLSNYILTYKNGSIQVLAISPVVTILTPTKLSPSSGTLNATVTDGGSLTTVALRYSTDPLLKGAIAASFSTGNSPLSPGAGKIRFASLLSGLPSGTTYYYQISASNIAGTALSQVQTFKTLSTNASLAIACVSSNALSPAFSNLPLSPSFSSGIYTYLSVAVSTENTVDLNLLTADPNATVQVNGMQVESSSSTVLPLHAGNNAIQILVTAEDGVTQLSYLINVYRVIARESLVAGNILSPNHDGKNDLWVVKDIQYYPNNTVTVYDRLGRIVYTKNGYTNDWGGTLRGALLNEDTYYYLVDFGPGERKMKGFISIVRDL